MCKPMRTAASAMMVAMRPGNRLTTFLRSWSATPATTGACGRRRPSTMPRSPTAARHATTVSAQLAVTALMFRRVKSAKPAIRPQRGLRWLRSITTRRSGCASSATTVCRPRAATVDTSRQQTRAMTVTRRWRGRRRCSATTASSTAVWPAMTTTSKAASRLITLRPTTPARHATSVPIGRRS